MTYEEAKEKNEIYQYMIQEVRNHKETWDYNFVYEKCDFLIDVLVKAIKYRWHDLRKNPNDLPEEKDGSLKLVYVIHRYNHDDGYYDYDMAFTYNDGFENRWIFKSAKTHDIYEVVAWREIEPFEEEK